MAILDPMIHCQECGEPSQYQGDDYIGWLPLCKTCDNRLASLGHDAMAAAWSKFTRRFKPDGTAYYPPLVISQRDAKVFFGG